MNGLSNLDDTYRANVHHPLLMTWLHSGGQISKVKVTAGRRGGEGIHVYTLIEDHLLVSNSNWSFTKPITITANKATRQG